MENALTVDVEDYFQVSAFDKQIPRSQWPSMESRVVNNTQRILKLFSECNVRGTFFVLGWVAEHFPMIVREIVDNGHELASHGYWHRLVYRQSADEFRQDVRRSRQLLEDLGGVAVRTYRAPSFSITKESIWALTVLAEEGYTVDSSIFPIRHDRYGVPDANPSIHQLTTSSGTITEFPPSVLYWRKFSLPVAGGGYFRLYPAALTIRAFGRINRHRPGIFYIHPWEIDSDQPRLDVGSVVTRFRHYVNLSRTERKLKKLLTSLSFGPVGRVLSNLAVDHEIAV